MVLIITDLPDEDLHVADFSSKGYGFDTSCELTVKKSLKYAIAAFGTRRGKIAEMPKYFHMLKWEN